MPRSIACGRFRLAVRRPPLVMGILNVTPDSFSDGGRAWRLADAVRHAKHMAADGASVIDVGGESTRPKADPVPLEEELRRVIPVIRALAKQLAVPLSVDTSKAEVARQAIAAGASMVNDVTALRGDLRMAEVVAASRVPVVLMHMQGTPATMQEHPRYRHVVEDVRAFLIERIRAARRAGIRRDQILIDPGIGFGKLLQHNLALLRDVDVFVRMGFPVVLGPSRKSFIGGVLGAELPDRLPGTLACVAYAAQHGVQIVRVHDIKPAVQVARMWHAIADPKTASVRRRCALA